MSKFSFTKMTPKTVTIPDIYFGKSEAEVLCHIDKCGYEPVELTDNLKVNYPDGLCFGADRCLAYTMAECRHYQPGEVRLVVRKKAEPRRFIFQETKPSDPTSFRVKVDKCEVYVTLIEEIKS